MSQLNGRVTLGGANFNICEPHQLVLSPPSCGDFLSVVWLLLRCSNCVLTMFGSPAAAPSGLICTFIEITRRGANFTAYYLVVDVDWFLVIWQVLWPEFFDPQLPPRPVAWWRGVMIGVGRWLAICMKATEGHRRPLLDVVLTMDCLMTGVVGRLALEIFTGRYRSPCCLFELRFILCWWFPFVQYKCRNHVQRQILL